eukprot:TRINITY_DN2203_c0_g1_i1.p1 TRINITY_DN2203_c0_g1~~TRINITY_DN2203_c0_g1_i1.p1  ORF type:complete len:355 (-),score=91.17 TRINITY_DN2203_c0_g1_i1:13-1047(-)
MIPRFVQSEHYFKETLNFSFDEFENNNDFYIFARTDIDVDYFNHEHIIKLKALQQLVSQLDCKCVIQIHPLFLEEKHPLLEKKNLRDPRSLKKLAKNRLNTFEGKKQLILDFGFNPEKTLIVSEETHFASCYKTICHVGKVIKGNDLQSYYPEFFIENPDPKTFFVSNILFDIATLFPISFPEFLSPSDKCVFFTDDYDVRIFYLAQLSANILQNSCPMPGALIFKKIPALTSLEDRIDKALTHNSILYINDNNKPLKKKIRSAFSGGQATIEEQQEKGANIEVDIAVFFIRLLSLLDLDCDFDAIEHIVEEYAKGRKNSGEIKQLMEEKILAIFSEIVKILNL